MVAAGEADLVIGSRCPRRNPGHRLVSHLRSTSLLAAGAGAERGDRHRHFLRPAGDDARPAPRPCPRPNRSTRRPSWSSARRWPVIASPRSRRSCARGSRAPPERDTISPTECGTPGSWSVPGGASPAATGVRQLRRAARQPFVSLHGRKRHLSGRQRSRPLCPDPRRRAGLGGQPPRQHGRDHSRLPAQPDLDVWPARAQPGMARGGAVLAVRHRAAPCLPPSLSALPHPLVKDAG